MLERRDSGSSSGRIRMRSPIFWRSLGQARRPKLQSGSVYVGCGR
jgi:hypothetical protein